MAFNLQEFCVDLLGQAVKKHVEPKCNNVPLWDNGVRVLAEGLVQASIPNVTGDVVAERALQMMGLRRGPSPYPASGDRSSQLGPVIDVTAERVP